MADIDSERQRRRSILGIDVLEDEARRRRETAGASYGDSARRVSEDSLGACGASGAGASAAVPKAAASAGASAAVPKAAVSFNNAEPSEHYGVLQAVVDELFEGQPAEYEVRRLDAVIAAESADIPDELMDIVTLLPPGTYSRKRLCSQLNSAIGGHAWGQVYGTVA